MTTIKKVIDRRCAISIEKNEKIEYTHNPEVALWNEKLECESNDSSKGLFLFKCWYKYKRKKHCTYSVNQKERLSRFSGIWFNV